MPSKARATPFPDVSLRPDTQLLACNCGNLTILETFMAQKTFIQLVDDLDGTTLSDGEGQTVTFALEGVSYEIDLSQAHVGELTDALAPYVEAGRKVNGRKNVARTSGAKSDPAELQKIRDWAGKNGHTVSSRGRISAAVRDAYDAAQ